jgi:hypothetical protein
MIIDGTDTRRIPRSLGPLPTTECGIIAPTFFTSLFELHRSAPWLALGVIDAASIAAMLLLERRLPTDALRAPAPGRVAA